MKSSVSARRTLSPTVGPYMPAYAAREIFVAIEYSPLCELAHHRLPEAIDLAIAGDFDELDIPRLARLEPDGSARGDIETKPLDARAIEGQGRVGFEKMVMAADLDRPVAGIGDSEGHRLAA